MKSLWRKG